MFSALYSYAPAQVLSAATVFVLIALQTNYLSIESYGYFAIYMLVVELIRALCSQWISTSLLRLYPSSTRVEKKTYIATTLILVWLLLFPAIAFIGLVLLLRDSLSFSVFLSLCCLICTKTIYFYYLDIARLTNNSKGYGIAVLIQSVMSVFFTLIFLSNKATVGMAAYSLGASYFLGLLVVFRRFKLKRVPIQKNFQVIFNYGWPLVLSGMLSVLASRIDRLFIADFLGVAQAGLYSAISNMLLGVMSLVFMVVAMPLYPELTRLVSKPSELRLQHSLYLDMLMFICLPALIGVCFIAAPLTKVLLGDEYLSEGVEVYWLLAVSFFLLNLKGHYFDHGLQFALKTKYIPLVTGISVVVNISLLFLLIKPIGLLGTGISLLLANFIALLISMMLGMRAGYNYQTGPSFFKIILSTSIMAMSLYLGQFIIDALSSMQQLIIQVVNGVVIYTISSYFLNCCDFRKRISQVGTF